MNFGTRTKKIKTGANLHVPSKEKSASKAFTFIDWSPGESPYNGAPHFSGKKDKSKKFKR
jgi:hypothetical protein